MDRSIYIRTLAMLLIGTVMTAAMVACGSSDTVIQTVIVEKVVTEKGDTVVQTVIVTEKGDTITVVATPTAAPVELAPDPQSGNDTAELVASNQVGLTMSGLNNVGAPDGPYSIAEGFFQPCGPVGADLICPVLGEEWTLSLIHISEPTRPY